MSLALDQSVKARIFSCKCNLSSGVINKCNLILHCFCIQGLRQEICFYWCSRKQNAFNHCVLLSFVPGPDFVACSPAKFISYPLSELFGRPEVCSSPWSGYTQEFYFLIRLHVWKAYLCKHVYVCDTEAWCGAYRATQCSEGCTTHTAGPQFVCIQLVKNWWSRDLSAHLKFRRSIKQSKRMRKVKEKCEKKEEKPCRLNYWLDLVKQFLQLFLQITWTCFYCLCN